MKLPKHSRIEAVGIAWYRREDYSLLLALFDDSAVLPRTFDEWLAKAEETEREVSKTGLRVSRVLLIPQEFTHWCASHGLRPDAEARSRFASERA